ncbi:hypothetical protein OUZ56_014003 [Daphnia magna]|uniref:Nucleolar protein 10 n=1 Tax=Daphnia magna TaxID=35525 RepID=A0ABQ9Z7K9_9CRUS|nr:hypothetical protein OUZ56_014003 [Daphnia magna]
MDPQGKPTISAHPARFSPEDKYSQQRIIIKKRFGLLPTQKATANSPVVQSLQMQRVSTWGYEMA